MCDSTYTIDFRTGEKLTCLLTHHGAEGPRGLVHFADYGTNSFYWNDREADK